jgi:hypothetical protein
VQLAISIYSADGTLVSGFDTKRDGCRISAQRGAFEAIVSFPLGLPLARGTYRFAVSILDEDCLAPYATREAALIVPVRSTTADSGWAHISRQWRVSP